MGMIYESYNRTIGVNGDALERNNKQKEYLHYINEHIGFVNKAFRLYFLPLLDKNFISTKISDEELKDAIRKCQEHIQYHDNSKYEEDEFEQYRLAYYPTTEEASRGEEFQEYVKQISEEAWAHHYKSNPHHPAYWIDENNVIKDMTLDYIIEMICDWEAMSMKFKQDSINWYKNDADKEKSQMTERTKELVEEILFNITHI